MYEGLKNLGYENTLVLPVNTPFLVIVKLFEDYQSFNTSFQIKSDL